MVILQPWHGSQDCHVALLANLPRRGLCRCLDCCAELVQALLGLLDLLVDQPQASSEGADVSGSRRDRARRYCERLLAQDAQDFGRIEAANAVVLEDTRDRVLGYPCRLGRGRHLLPQIEEPIGSGVAELTGLRVIPPQLVTHPIGQSLSRRLSNKRSRTAKEWPGRDHSPSGRTFASFHCSGAPKTASFGVRRRVLGGAAP